MLSARSFAADPNPPRVFFSDANISFTVPNHWTLEPKFPYGPLFTKPTSKGEMAIIACAISAPLDAMHVSSDVSQEVLRQLAKSELVSHQDGYHMMSEKDRTLSDHHVYEVTWENIVDNKALKHQTAYFYVDNRLYAISLQTPALSFKWLEPDFQHWLGSLRILSRMDHAALLDPSHGGVWIHQTGGVKITMPDAWLIAVADDHQLGAAYAQGEQHTEFTAVVDASSSTPKEFNASERKEAIKSIRKKGLRIVDDKADAFHGLPSYTVRYEGTVKDRLIKGMDIWVQSPHGRWLFSLEGDVSLYNSLADPYQDLLKSIEFL